MEKIYTCGKCGKSLIKKPDDFSPNIYKCHCFCEVCGYQFSIYSDDSTLFYITPDNIEKDFSVPHIRPLNLPQLEIELPLVNEKVRLVLKDCKIITDLSYNELIEKLLDGIWVVVSKDKKSVEVGWILLGG